MTSVTAALAAFLLVGSAAPRPSVTIDDTIVGNTFTVGYAELSAPMQPFHIQAGDTVRWTNLDTASHDVTSDDSFCGANGCKPFTAYLGNGAMVSFTFAQPGYYLFHCNQHPEVRGMYGLVYVDRAGAPTSAGPGHQRRPVHVRERGAARER